MNKLFYEKYITFFAVWENRGACLRCYGEMVWSFAPVEGLYLCWVNKKAEAEDLRFCFNVCILLPSL